MGPEDKVLIDGLKQIMGQEGTSHAELLVACEQKLEDDKSGWEHGWLPWKGDHLRNGRWLGRGWVGNDPAALCAS